MIIMIRLGQGAELLAGGFVDAVPSKLPNGTSSRVGEVPVHPSTKSPFSVECIQPLANRLVRVRAEGLFVFKVKIGAPVNGAAWCKEMRFVGGQCACPPLANHALNDGGISGNAVLVWGRDGARDGGGDATGFRRGHCGGDSWHCVSGLCICDVLRK